MNRGFGSDNHSGTHPQFLKAIQECNGDHEPSYGTDQYCIKAQQMMSELFGKPVETYFVFNGTGANVFALRSFVDRFESVICGDYSHLNVDECGAAEAIGGYKLIPLPSIDGKISVSDIEKAIIRKGDQHFSQVKAVSITQPTEVGTLYTLDEIKQISDLCHRHGMYLHVDGARIANAVVSLKSDFKETITDTGVDVLSFGGTKNGMLFGEAVVFLNPQLCKTAKFHRKQLAQLPSKSRFIANQFYHYLSGQLWQEIAGHSLSMAQKLASAISNCPQVKITHPVQSNGVFAQIPQKWVKKLREDYFFYVWDENTFECRLMCSWDTTAADIQGFASALKNLSENSNESLRG
jgi:threonine aldolase